MNKILFTILFILFLGFAHQANAAIAVNATSTGAESSSSSKTWAHTVSGANTILFVSGWIRGNGVNPTGVTYNGVAMTQIGTNLVVSTFYYDKIFLYYLIAPTTGTNNVVVSFGGTNYNATIAISYTGAKQSGVPDAATENGPTSTDYLTTTLTTIADNCWTLLVGFGKNMQQTAYTGSTYRIGAGATIFDSNGVITPPAAYSMTFKVRADGGSENAVAQMISFAPAVAAAPPSIESDILWFSE